MRDGKSASIAKCRYIYYSIPGDADDRGDSLPRHVDMETRRARCAELAVDITQEM